MALDQEHVKDEKEMSFLGHLEELRWRIVRSVIAILIFGTVAFIYNKEIVDYLLIPQGSQNFPTYRIINGISQKLGLSESAVLTDVSISLQTIVMTEKFTLHLLIAFVGGLIVAFPYILLQIWKFIQPGLKERETKNAKGVVLYGSLLFFFGVLFGYFIVSPLSIQFFGNYFFSDAVEDNFRIGSFLTMVVQCTFFSGLLFMLPVFIFILSKIGIVSPPFLRKYRKHAIVSILILSALITPPDIITQILVSIPILILYEIGIIVSKTVEPREVS